MSIFLFVVFSREEFLICPNKQRNAFNFEFIQFCIASRMKLSFACVEHCVDLFFIRLNGFSDLFLNCFKTWSAGKY